MENLADNRAWFRPKTYGYGYTPVRWQGWVSILVFVALLFATVLAAAPGTAKPHSVLLFLKMKAMFGLGGTHLRAPAMAAFLAIEVAAFFVFTRWKSSGSSPDAC